ncbi:phosphatase domain-containing protein [Pseudoalteromonas luteoviolacea]|uniref:Tyrosine specific protein phosphatases domain-containing protein n=1 Tax=Pseudoalteromonas luteoviolacea H33 TaxID=1365251 RepID=A0A161Y185_9GAMM|nr:dual specificity protein phosphatase family protein [Pseudoalteromonas luteoviolacea]KZN49760.1 hypothetical protein N476_18380 [Pseudoalteromonas luteoviolacea H33]KZN77784.1 hypothetical protein N477_00835 [Pseudoalteromonas luteoviolacea H33-S]MBQ4878732.1 dual specificity protein phosphatase family protein [Pseudoalteromonas luteoviolacea]MBQ4907860.1 dual specificity protein phosphatase family protein [Pseudoalteromonas luteoviolacea]
MQTHPFDKLSLDNGATFIFTPCPGTKDVGITESVTQLKGAGTDAIITLMYDSELLKNNAQSLAQVCKEQNVKWFQFPLPDDDEPNQDFVNAFNNHIEEVFSILESKGTVAVHCKGGSGRTGLVIGLLMKRLGYDHADVLQQIQTLRPKALKHPSQLQFFNTF